MARSYPSYTVASPRTDASGRLAAEARRRLERARPADMWRVERVEVEADACEPLTWLAAQPLPSKVYWHGRGEKGAMAGAARPMWSLELGLSANCRTGWVG